MRIKITKDVLESYLHCKYKGYLKLTDQQGTKCDYENLLTGMRAEVRLVTIEKILAAHAGEEIPRNVRLTTSALRQGASFILDAILEDDLVCLVFDGLKKVDGPSKLGDFHYVPMLFHEGTKVRKEQRLLLEVYGLLLSRLQGQMPVNGIIWHGNECKTTRVRLNADMRKTERLLRDLGEMCSSESAPRLMLNDHCQVCEFRQRCHSQAIQEDNLSLLRGMGEKQVKNYARKGVLTITQLAHVFRPRRKGKRPEYRCNRYHALQALAIRDKRIYVFGTPELQTSTVKLYLDMEGMPEDGFVYLIGMIVVKDGSEQHYTFWADGKDQERHIFDQFLATVAQFDNFLVFCYGGYERAFLKRMRKQAKRKKLLDKVLDALVNTLSVVYSHLYFPTYSNGLKDIAGCLGCSWTDEDASGIQSIVWRQRWEDTHDDTWKRKLTTYNLEDCVALKTVTEFLYAIPSKSDPQGRPILGWKGEAPPVVPVQDIDLLANPRKWGRINFFHSDYDYINNCAYFDYQRQRVYVRTNETIRKHHARYKKQKSQKPRISKRIEILSSACPSCGCTELTRRARKKQCKRAFDLVIAAGGIKRRVIECVAPVHWCLACGKRFLPEKYQRLAKHFHGLKSWAMFEHVAHQASFGTIHERFREYFGLRVFTTEIQDFKFLMARHYQQTYRRLLKKILSGNVLHVDETEVKLRTGKGYIWVLTNLEEAVYIYRPTREGEFLGELLKDFHGVLISDFYGSYDSIGCPQQKCLIHLMRDINQELLNNPYDEELQAVTRPFGTLLRAIVATVDKHGLKRRYLKRHDRAVARYLRSLSAKSFRSEAAETLRQRLLKYQDKLFTFIKYDGVPWNNNNAENAIRRFAYYREGTVGIMKEAGLKDYLVLLSIYQTCRYKEISFFKFLLSRERDVDLFGKKKRRRRSDAIEVHPKGVVPPSVVRRQKPKQQNDSPDVTSAIPQEEAAERPSQASSQETSEAANLEVAPARTPDAICKSSAPSVFLSD